MTNAETVTSGLEILRMPALAGGVAMVLTEI